MADYISQIQLPNNSTYDFRDKNLKLYTGSCATAAGTAIKDVTTDGAFTLEKGAIIFVNFTSTNSAAVGNLKLKINGEADANAKPIKYLVNGNDPANIPGAGYLRANQTYMFRYDGTNWVADLNYYTYSNDFASRIGHYNNILARKAIAAESLIVGDETGYEKVASGVTFNLAYPIVWCTSAVNVNASNYANMFLQHYDRNIATGAKSGFTSTANKAIYLIVTLDGNIATIDSNIITDTLPSSDDGKVYISLGKLGAQSTGANYFFLYPVHPMFWYKNGAIREYSGASEYALAAPLSGISGADDLKVIEALSDETTGFLKKTAANTWTLDPNSYSTTSHDHNTTYYKLDGSNTGTKLCISTQAAAHTNQIQFMNSTTKKGSIGTDNNGVIGVYGSSKVVLRPVLDASTKGVEVTTSAMYPTASITLGTSTAANKWSTVYATTFDGTTAALTHAQNQSDGLKIKYSTTIDYFIGVGTGNANHGLYDNKASGGAKWILYAGSDNKWILDASVAWNNITSKPTTISDYGITDAKITNDVITLGSSTITPVTSVNGHSGASVSVTASDLGLASALKYVGTKSSLPTATDSTTYSTYNNGDVITVSNKEYAYVKGSNAAGSSWVELGDEGSYKLKQTAFTNSTGTADGSNTSTTFIYSFSQDENGVITDIKTRKLPTYNNYSHPTGDGNLHVPATGTDNNGKFLKAGSTAGSLSWATLTVSDISNIASTYLKLDGSNNMTADVNIIAGDTDKFVNFWYNTDKKAGASWRVGMLGSGSQDTNYFVIQSGTSTTSATTWNNTICIGQNTYDAGFGGNVYPLANNKTLGTTNNKWSAIYATTYDGSILKLHQGTAADPSLSGNARIEFDYSAGQPVVISYTPNDSYRSPAGLKIIGGTSASPAWLEVEGNIYAAAFKGHADSATSANYINLYEARGTTTTLNKVANYVGAGKMFHLVASSNTSATDNGKTPTDANILQMNWDNSGGYDAQLGIATGINRMYFRSRPSQKIAWDEVAHAPVGTAGVGNATQPVYMTSEGVITAITAVGAAYGGTGKTTLKDSANTLINALDTGSSDLTANDYIITQYVGGGTTTTSYHRRPANKVVNATLVKAALGTNTSTTTQWLNKKGEWSTPTAAQIGAAPAVNGGYLPLSGGTMTGGITLPSKDTAFNTYNLVFSSGGIIGGNTSGNIGIYAGTIYLCGGSNNTTNSGQGITVTGTQVDPYATNEVSLGTSSLKYKNIYATTFTGNLTGNATTATAIQTAGTTAQFYRGDNSWSNIIKQTANAVLGIDTNLKIGTARKDLNFDIANGSGTGINDGYAGGITWGLGTAAYAGIYYQTSGNYGSRLIFGTTGSYANGAYARMIIQADGKIGINTLSPDSQLHVSGITHIGKIKITTGTSDIEQRTITTTEQNLILNAPASYGVVFNQGGTTKIRQVGSTFYPEGTTGTLGTDSNQWFNVYSDRYTVTNHVTIKYNSTDQSLDFIFS